MPNGVRRPATGAGHAPPAPVVEVVVQRGGHASPLFPTLSVKSQFRGGALPQGAATAADGWGPPRGSHYSAAPLEAAGDGALLGGGEGGLVLRFGRGVRDGRWRLAVGPRHPRRGGLTPLQVAAAAAHSDGVGGSPLRGRGRAAPLRPRGGRGSLAGAPPRAGHQPASAPPPAVAPPHGVRWLPRPPRDDAADTRGRASRKKKRRERPPPPLDTGRAVRTRGQRSGG